VLALALFLGYRYTNTKGGSGGKVYRHNLAKWTDPKVNFDQPSPIDQSLLYKTVEEIVEPLSAKLHGSVPDWLSGTLLRDGPGLFEFGDEHALHAFDGMAMIRRYHVEKGMNFSRRLIDSDILRANRQEQRFTKYGVGTPAKGGVMDRLKGLQEPGADNLVVNTLKLFGHYYAASELPQIIEYDPVTLESLGKVDLTELIPGIKLVTPHPLYEPDGTMWNIAFATGPDREGNSNGVWRYVVFKVTPPQNEEEKRNPWVNLKIVAEKASSRMMSVSYLHSFFMTENYVIFTEMPWIFGSLPETIYMHVIKGKNLGEIMYWDKDTALSFHVMEKSTGNFLPTAYEGDPLGFYHIINAYEEDWYIIIDAPFKSTPTTYNVFMVEPLAGSTDTLAKYMDANGPAAGTSKRWVLPIQVPADFTPPSQLILTPGGQVDPDSYQSLIKIGNHQAKAWHVEENTVYLHPEMLAPAEQYQYQRAFEFIAINPNLAAKKYRYGYGLGFPSGYLCGTIHKLDVEEKVFTAMWEDKACRATEPQFVPRPGGIEEEDGVVVFACLGTNSDAPSTYFVVLDPTNLKELGRFSVPSTTPVGFHGIWISGS